MERKHVLAPLTLVLTMWLVLAGDMQAGNYGQREVLIIIAGFVPTPPCFLVRRKAHLRY